mmetsp:Transcript_43264/g.106275  ORF Transcript_43264/g.106275 Transcript_43264/m.106275 type:complete len:180 (+) Transcript_43264:50-589(+)
MSVCVVLVLAAVVAVAAGATTVAAQVMAPGMSTYECDTAGARACEASLSTCRGQAKGITGMCTCLSDAIKCIYDIGDLTKDGCQYARTVNFQNTAECTNRCQQHFCDPQQYTPAAQQPPPTYINQTMAVAYVVLAAIVVGVCICAIMALAAFYNTVTNAADVRAARAASAPRRVSFTTA